MGLCPCRCRALCHVGMAQTRCRTLFPPAGCGFDPVLLLADFPLSRSDDAPRPDGGRRLLARAGEDAACLGGATSVLSRSGATRASGFGSARTRFLAYCQSLLYTATRPKPAPSGPRVWGPAG